MKRLAVVASGWHFPLHFFRSLSEQRIPRGWQVDLFCISHRDPSYSKAEKKEVITNLGNSRRESYDKILYEHMADIRDIEAAGWKYTLEPNTVGDWGNINQWLEKNDYEDYDMFLFTHDDNFILSDTLFEHALTRNDWLILSNSDGNSQRRIRRWLRLKKPFNIRGSFEFFTKEMLDIIGGKFDLSMTSLTRENQFSSGVTISELSDWNSTVTPLTNLLKERKLFGRVKSLSKYYRMSIYCLEGERGYIHKTEPSNTAEEEAGLDLVDKFYSK